MFARKTFACVGPAFSRGIRKTPQLPFTGEQQCQVLEVLNSSTESQLRKLLGPSLGVKIVYQREQKGPFSSLEAMFDIKGTSFKSVMQFCESILYDRKKEKATPGLSFLTPAISESRINSMDTVVAVDVTQLFVTYAVMDREHKILQLNRIDMPAETTRNSIPALYELAEFVYPKLAKKGDVYIMEQPSSHLQNVSSSMMSRRILQSMVYTMLNFGEPDYPKVFQLKNMALSKLFPLKMGSEQIACEPTLRSLIEEKEIRIPLDVMARIDRASPVHREYFGLCILRCLAVYRLCNI